MKKGKDALYRRATCTAGMVALVVGAGFAPKLAAAPDPSCVNYLTVGDSDCRAQAARQTIAPQPQPLGQPVSVSETKSEVDRYLDNYGKPPREFVEFYLNPTAENAARWMHTYQQMLQKGQDLSKAWTEAEQLYGDSAPTQAPQSVPSLIEPQIPESMIVPQSISAPPQVPIPPSGAARFGGFAETVSGVSQNGGGVRNKGVSLTYFFSQTCPYCARMTPELAVLAKEMQSKLTFTCVDVTPFGPTSKPDQAAITSKLPCQWRLPESGEVEREGVTQTPTLIIVREGEAPVRLSGYVPLAQLRQQF